jgi:hypothetical protein
MGVGYNSQIDKRIADVPDKLRRNSKLTSFDYSTPGSELLFLRNVDKMILATNSGLERKGAARS